MSEQVVTSIEQLAALDLGQWILDANDVAWVLFDTDVMGRQRMWRSKTGSRFVSHEMVALPAYLAVAELECEHKKLSWEGWQCARCGHVVNEPPPVPAPVVAEPGRAWFLIDDTDEWCDIGPDFAHIIAMAEDIDARPHDQAARDRYRFELMAMARVFRDPAMEDSDVAQGLELIIRHLVARATDGGQQG